jgi:hypothetical protein
MSYKTPHHAHEFLKAACLTIVHEYTLACQRKSQNERRNIVLLKREIDLHSRLAMHFGPEASMAAQGTSALDLSISSPRIRAEVKYLRRKPNTYQPVNLWNGKKGVKHDWEWLLQLKNVGDAFRKTVLVFFLPSKSFLEFHQVCDLKPVGTSFQKSDYAPFVRLVRRDPSNTSRLIYRDKAPHDLLIRMGGKVIVRRQMIGFTSQPIWALVYSRVGTGEYKNLTEFEETTL